MIKKKLNNRGFTLVELLAVFVILISVSLVAVGGITSSLEKREEKEFEEIEAMSISGAKIYFSLLDKGNKDNCVNVGELIDGGYFSSNNVNKAEKYRNNYSVIFSNNNYVFRNILC